jgi:hypothetical protein
VYESGRDWTFVVMDPATPYWQSKVAGLVGNLTGGPIAAHGVCVPYLVSPVLYFCTSCVLVGAVLSFLAVRFDPASFCFVSFRFVPSMLVVCGLLLQPASWLTTTRRPASVRVCTRE